MTASDKEIFDDRVTPSFSKGVNDVCERFEQAWKSGDRPDISTFLQELPDPDSQLLLEELIKLDVHYRRTKNEIVSRSDYAGQFPEFAANIRALLDEMLEAGGLERVPPADKETVLTGDGAARRRFRVGPRDVTHLDNYELLEEIARGGQGIVFKALNLGIDRVMALKILLNLDQDGVERFLREGRLSARLMHPNIVQVHDLRQEFGVPFLVMEFIEGIDLARLSGSVGHVTVADGCEMIRQAAIGLQYAHEHGLVHRDIKPSNLILSRDGNVKILDMGLAMLRNDNRPADKRTPDHTLIGTFPYMAPEQAADPRIADIRADIYSLGCTLFELLTTRQPFGDEESSITELIVAHQMAPIPRLRTFRPDVPQELDDLVSQMLAKSPADRPATPREVGDKLTPFAVGSQLRELAAIGVSHDSRGDAVDAEVVSQHDPSSKERETEEPVRLEEVTDPPGTAAGEDWIEPVHSTIPEPEGPVIIAEPTPQPSVRHRIAPVGLGITFLIAAGLAWWQWQTRPLPLLNKQEFQTTLRQGDWIYEPSGVVSPIIPCAWLRVTQALPREFALRLRVERLEGYRFAFVNVSHENSFTVSFSAGVHPLDRAEPDVAVRDKRGQPDLFAVDWGDWGDDSPRDFLLTVGEKSLRLNRNGETIIDWHGDFVGSMQAAPSNDVPTEPGFYLLTERSVFRFECSRE